MLLSGHGDMGKIEACAGSHFDPRLARLFVAEYRLHGHTLKRYRVAPEPD